MGKGTISSQVLDFALKRGLRLYRTDVGGVFENYINQVIEFNKKFNLRDKKILFDELVLSSGVIGQKYSFIVDNINKPNIFYGVADGNGSFYDIDNIKHSIRKRVLKFKKKLKLL